jgi:hypothetical protein
MSDYYTIKTAANFQKAQQITKNKGLDIHSSMKEESSDPYLFWIIEEKQFLTGTLPEENDKEVTEEEFFEITGPQTILTKYNKNLAEYLKASTRFSFDVLILYPKGGIDAASCAQPLENKKLVSHGEFILEWEKRNKTPNKTLDFTIAGRCPVLTPDALILGHKTIPWDKFKVLAEKVNKPTYEPLNLHTPYSAALWEYIKTLDIAPRILREQSHEDNIWFNNSNVGMGYTGLFKGHPLPWQEVSHGEFITALTAPMKRKEEIVTGVCDQPIVINNKGLNYEGLVIPFETFARLESSVVEYQK